MTCVLKTCAHAAYGACKTFARSGLGECGAAYALELASRNDGYMVHAHENPTIAALKAAGKVTTTPVAETKGRYVIARVVHEFLAPLRGYCKPLLPAAKIGRGIAIDSKRTEERHA